MTDFESLAASLVREYLSRKGFKRSLKVLDDEFPRTEDSIRNRVVLAKELKLEKLMRLNKELETPLRTMIEVMVKYFVTDRKKSQKHQSDEIPKKASSLKKSVSFSDVCGESTQAHNKDLNMDQKLTDEDLNHNRTFPINKRLKRGNIDSQNHSSCQRSSIHANHGHEKPKDITDIDKEISRKPNDRVNLEHVNRTKNELRNSRQQIQSTIEPKRKPGRKKTINLIDYSDSMRSNSTELLSKQDHIHHDTDRLKYNTEQTRSKLHKEDDFELQRGLLHGTKQDTDRRSHLKQSTSSNLILDDIDDDLSEDLNNLSLDLYGKKTITMLHDKTQAITMEVAIDLKSIIFGTSTRYFNVEWKNQSFSFCDLPQLEYGIVQIKGGPCGLLAAVQAIVLKYLLFDKDSRVSLRSPLQPTSNERTCALAKSLSEILWRAGARNSASVVIPSGKSKFIGGGRYKLDGLTETLMIYSFKDEENLRDFISQNIGQFESETSSGCVLFLYSLILSRGIGRIKKDMDEPAGTFIGSHGYCTQELVNLCLTGRAVSNVFDRTIELDSGANSKSILKGIDKQSDVGLLSLFEHYKSCEVGENYKSPKFPIWVIYSESHFSTLFSIERKLLQDRRLQKKFDLYYYDGLARQDEEIKLTIDTEKLADTDRDHMPPLELCIRTKWANASIDWNDTEPLL